MAILKYMAIARKLQTACNNSFGVRLCINTRQWYSEDKHRAVTCYYLTQETENEAGKKISVELFKTYSQIQLVLFLRDYWYELNGWEIPHDNEMWEEVKAQNADVQTAET